MNFDNPAFQIAADFIKNSNRSLFLTGKAGTGKTTFLKHIIKDIDKNKIVLAPTGVAAIHAGGSTIHSFFQLPFTPFVPIKKYGFNAGNGSTLQENGNSVDGHSLIARLKLTDEKRKLIRQLELMVIDEISMVRSDLLDAMDAVLKHFRGNRHEPFGGVQVLFIGDLFQLPPVMPDDQWQILSEYYASPYFFDSIVLKDNPPMQIELTKIYRQSEHNFIQLLNQIRNNELDHEGNELLQSRYDPSFQIPEKENYIQLTTHNAKADATNTYELEKLKSVLRTFKASIVGEFSEKAYPAEETLQLKIGAQVMFLKNDTEKVRRYFNGKIGVIEIIEGEDIVVKCVGQDAIKVRKDSWKNIRYALNKNTQQIQEDEVGSFTQYPLRLAWSITIHKSQGLTFEKAVIDAGSAFTYGQVYVALSRCTSLGGIVLKSMITANGLRTNDHVVAFLDQKLNENQQLLELRRSKFNYEQKTILELFDFKEGIELAQMMRVLIAQNQSSFNDGIADWVQKIVSEQEKWQTVAEKFQTQLSQMASDIDSIEDSTQIQQRIAAGSGYFVPLIQNASQNLAKSAVSTDNRQLAKQYNEVISSLNIYLALKNQLFKVCQTNFTLGNIQKAKAEFVAPVFKINSYGGNNENVKSAVANPILYNQLKDKRFAISESENMPIYLVCPTDGLEELSTYLPQNHQDILKINGFGEARAKKYGEVFLSIIREYCQSKGLNSNMAQLPPKKERKPKSDKPKTDTKLESFELYKQGKTMEEIATARNLSLGTIEGHLAGFVATGDIDIHTIVAAEKLVLIENVLKQVPENTGALTFAKLELGDKASYGEIKLVKAWVDMNLTV